MPCMKAITVILSSLFATAMTDTLLPVAPLLQTTRDVVCIRVHSTVPGAIVAWMRGVMVTCWTFASIRITPCRSRLFVPVGMLDF